MAGTKRTVRTGSVTSSFKLEDLALDTHYVGIMVRAVCDDDTMSDFSFSVEARTSSKPFKAPKRKASKAAAASTPRAAPALPTMKAKPKSTAEDEWQLGLEHLRIFFGVQTLFTRQLIESFERKTYGVRSPPCARPLHPSHPRGHRRVDRRKR